MQSRTENVLDAKIFFFLNPKNGNYATICEQLNSLSAGPSCVNAGYKTQILIRDVASFRADEDLPDQNFAEKRRRRKKRIRYKKESKEEEE